MVSGAKNAALPLLFASLLSKETCELGNLPDLEDIHVSLKLLESLGARVSFKGRRACVEAADLVRSEAPYALVKSLRASFWALGPLVARLGQARVSLPGGDAIGTRPVDLHLEGLRKFGVSVEMSHGLVIANVPGALRPANIKLRYPSVGATHHLLMTAALIPGESSIYGAACEPEVVELAHFLTKMGAEVTGAGTSTIRILGRSELEGAKIDVLGDRIEAATYLSAALVTAGDVYVKGVAHTALRKTLELLEQAGSSIALLENGIRLRGPKRIRAISFETAPFPGLATDVQPLLMAVCCLADGESRIRETVFENRYGHVAEYRRMGAEIDVSGDTATVYGVKSLSGAPVDALDIRAAAGLVLLGLAAEGVSEIFELHHLARGYDSLVGKLRSLGADVSQVPVCDQRELIFGC